VFADCDISPVSMSPLCSGIPDAAAARALRHRRITKSTLQRTMMRTSMLMVADTRLSFPMVESVHCMIFRRFRFAKDMRCDYGCVCCAVRVAESATLFVFERVKSGFEERALWYTAVRWRENLNWRQYRQTRNVACRTGKEWSLDRRLICCWWWS